MEVVGCMGIGVRVLPLVRMVSLRYKYLPYSWI